ncbi:MAG: SPFH domain-containing protein [Rhodocyclaceae bacterium]|nr:SPFH domain-containing protein [Rhodocyclaceae bacterium]
MSGIIEEREASYLSGWPALLIWLGLFAGALWQIFGPSLLRGRSPDSIVGFLALPVLIFLARGFIILPPNIATVFTFFGRYAGSLRRDGFFWVNPFYLRQRLSLRVHNLNTPTLKVNDRAGNPIDVGAVVVWRVSDTARAAFDVEDYASYIVIQSESAVRAVASTRWYDGDEHGNNSLRADLESVGRALADTIQEHVSLAGLEIIEARIAHLAYAQEIASAMLRRQQAAAVVAARTHIVEGAVGMVRLAIDQLEREGVVKLAPADRVHLVGNLLTVLVSDSETHPVISVDRAA